LGVPFSAAKCAEELTAYDWFVVEAMTEAKEILRRERERQQK
jgi:hypothetical protein